MPQQGRISEIKQGPHSLQPTRALHRTGTQRGRLLAWIGDQVRLKAFSGQLRAFIYKRRHSLMLFWEQEGRGNNKEKGDNKTGDNDGLIIAGNNKERGEQ
jgi:hypothetical protein